MTGLTDTSGGSMSVLPLVTSTAIRFITDTFLREAAYRLSDTFLREATGIFFIYFLAKK